MVGTLFRLVPAGIVIDVAFQDISQTYERYYTNAYPCRIRACRIDRVRSDISPCIREKIICSGLIDTDTYRVDSPIRACVCWTTSVGIREVCGFLLVLGPIWASNLLYVQFS